MFFREEELCRKTKFFDSLSTRTPEGEIEKMKSAALELARWLFALAAVLFITLSFTGNTVSNAAPETVEAAVTATLDMQTMQKADNQMIKRLYGLNPADFESCTLYYPTSNMGAEELLLVKLADTAQQQAVSDAVNARLETQKASFDGYGVEQFDMLTNHYVLEIRGNWILFVVNPSAKAAQSAFLGAL